MLRDARIAESNCIVQEYPIEAGDGVIRYGTGVTFLFNGEKTTYEIVGFFHGDPERNRIFYMSPIAQQLIGHKKGEKCVITLNKIKYDAEILRVFAIKED